MRSTIILQAFFFSCYSLSTLIVHANEKVTLKSLLQEIVKRDNIAQFPLPEYSCRQSSSYDRDSVSPNQQETWYANWDRSQFIRIEEKDGRKEYVMHDAEGPGAIVRIWATWHGPKGEPFSNGTIRFYFDHEETPRIEGPITDVIDKGLLVGPPLSQGVSPQTDYKRRGHNLYLPIPYAKHCKITYSTDVPVDRGAKKGEALYYQINYRTYAADTDVESFTMADLAEAKQAIEDANETLEAGWSGSASGNLKSVEATGSIPADGTTSLSKLKGPGAIRMLKFRLAAEDLEQALRSTVLQISFDGQRKVWCPVGEFFGSGYKLSPHKTWYTLVEEDGTMSCAWVMPFDKEAEVLLHNTGTQPVRVLEGLVQFGDWHWNERSMHFHSSWRELSEADTRDNKGMKGKGAFDVNYVTIQGQGVYVGDTLTVLNGAAKWWGEGDEKIYMDGETFPSHFGTGTEDYYGYAWCRPEFFNAPFHAQPEGGGNLAGGYSVNSRYRVLDAIPFQESLKLDMELWHWVSTKVNYAPATFWYARPGAESNVLPAPEATARPIAREMTDLVPVNLVKGAIEGESLKTIEKTGGTIRVQAANFGWSGESQLWWTGAKENDQLVVEFPVESAGNYKLRANLTKANDYAIVKLSVNGEPAKEFDRYHPKVEHDLVELGTFQLPGGPNRLTIRISGSNQEALPGRMFGLDYLQLEEIQD